MSTQKVVIEISMRSDCSDACLYDHLRSLIAEIDSMKYRSTHNKVYTDWEESYPVEIEIDSKIIED